MCLLWGKIITSLGSSQADTHIIFSHILLKIRYIEGLYLMPYNYIILSLILMSYEILMPVSCKERVWMKIKFPLAKHELTSKEKSGLRRGGWRTRLLLLPWRHRDSQNIVVASGGAHGNKGVWTTGPRIRPPASHDRFLWLQQYKEAMASHLTPPSVNVTRRIFIIHVGCMNIKRAA
jgi:hypothetical protein